MANQQQDRYRNSPRVREILSYYAGSPPGVLANLARIMNHGQLGGTGKLVILPVDQGFEHGPARSFAQVATGYDPRAHLQMAATSGCSAYAAPLGALEAAASEFAGEVPLILKVNSADSLSASQDPCPAQTASVQDALRLGACAVGFTLYPGSARRNDMLEAARELVAEARSVGLPTVIWSYPRGSGMSKAGQQAVDVVAYAAHIACQLGAHIVKVKPPTDHVEGAEAKKVYAACRVPIRTLEERVRHVVTSCFAGRRIVVFSGGASRGEEAVLQEVAAITAGGGFGSIMGRNVFQRPEPEARALLDRVIRTFANAP